MAGLVEEFQSYVGRRETASDVVTASAVARLAATLDVDNPAVGPGDPLPPGWDCSYFTNAARPGELSPDGLPATPLLPPIALPRRMFGGARLRIAAPLRIGDEITQTTELARLEEKETRAGPMVSALVRRTIANARGTVSVEEQNILYLGEAPKGPPPPGRPAPDGAAWRRVVTPDPILLFRFSAITFNAHRIHYDRPYAEDTEGYPGLLVQGRLLALLLLELWRANRPDAPVREFAYRAVRPVYLGANFILAGAVGEDGASLWVAGGDGTLAMTADVKFAED